MLISLVTLQLPTIFFPNEESEDGHNTVSGTSKAHAATANARRGGPVSRVSRDGRVQRPVVSGTGRAPGHSAGPGTGAAPAAAGGNSTTDQTTIAITHPTAGTKAGLQPNPTYWQNRI